MSVTRDIVASWRGPRAVMRAHLARPRSEPFAFTLLVTFLIVAFVAQWPAASRQTVLQPDVPMTQRLLAAALALAALVPFWYLLAAIGHWVARAMGAGGDHYRARLALFWALVTVSPLMLLQGLVAGMIGPGPALTSVSVLAGLAFLTFWVINLNEAGR
ncbi:YIP1 family protein [Szabonella alba]|uniref:YIP1 family protein n=1 Tax=Szabonella alba TaxID=2804194 RepID=A0A8K0XYR8_9RHOB|nr:YIP1 family protein [Szabonella alba]MBL4916350.1 YIP1 family protein [Szabonella alba]